jgi:hypothetical protein
MELLTALEGSSFATWLRQSPSIWAYPAVLTLHTVGLALLVGANWALDLRVLGVARSIPLPALTGAFRIMWIGFWVNAISGVMLFAADATTKGVTTVFQWKLAMVLAGVAGIVLLRRALYRGGRDAGPQVSVWARTLAAGTFVLWVAAIAAGRFMAYI